MPLTKSSKVYQSLQVYSHCISANSKSFPCPLCNAVLLPKQFEKHCSQRHDFNSRLCCVWCRGAVSWSSGQKNNHVDHLLPCFRKFMKLTRVFTPQTVKETSSSPSRPHPVPFDMKPMAPRRDLFDHEFDPPPRAYDAIWPVLLDPNPVTFENDSLDKAVACVRKYLQLGDGAEWFHVMVRSLAFPAFLEAMDRDEGRTRTLPFSCWCDGGRPDEPRLRQHRHLIVVSSPPGRFAREVWGAVDVEDRPRRNFKCLHSERIVSPMHLVNTIGYLCKRESRCNFASSGDKKSPEKLNHFYLFESLPKDYRLPLALQWEGGLLQLLGQNFKNLKRGDLVRSVVSFFERRWRFQIKHIPGITLNTVLPVTVELRPCGEPTESFLHLAGARKLYFERNPDLRRLTREAWLKEQADMGNLFYHVVGEELWTPRPYHQALINEFKPLVDRNGELESENTRLNHETARWKEKCGDAEGQTKTLTDAISKLNDTNSKLNDANSKLNDKNSELNDKINQLHDKIHHLNEVEIARLKRENEEFREELAKVKKENEKLKRENESLKRENEELKQELGRAKRPKISVHFAKNNPF